jgi:hypothetical protein
VSVVRTEKERSRTFGTSEPREARKGEESRRTMNSYSTHNDVTALEFCWCRKKTRKRGEKSGRVVSDRGSLRRA